MESFGQWLARLHSHMSTLNWERVIRDGDKNALHTIERAISEWMKANKPPLPGFPGFLKTKGMPLKPGHMPSHYPRHLKGTAQLAEEARLAEVAKRVEQSGYALRVGRMRSARHVVRGSANLVGMLIGLGTAGTGFLASKAGLVFLSKLAARWYIEDKIIDYGASKIAPVMQAIDEATMPNTLAEAESMYAGYLRSRHHRFTTKGDLIEWDEPGVPLSREEWLAETYGIDWSVLR